MDEIAFDLEKQFEILDGVRNDYPAAKVLIDIYKKSLKSTKYDFQLDETSRKVFEAFFPNLDPNASLWDLSKAFGYSAQAMIRNKQIWLDLRKYIYESGGKLESNAGNWEQKDVITKVDDYIKKTSPTVLSFYEYIQFNYKDREKPATLYELYQSAYLTLDLMGYKSDSLPKPTDSMLNISTDADHSFLAQTCDLFVLEDKKMKAKTEALYHYFNISTKVINLSDFVESCSELIFENDINTPESIINEFFKEHWDQLIELVSDNKEPFNSNLQKRLVNFFDFVHLEFNKESSLMCFTFSKDEFKYARFLYFTEKEYLVNELEKFFKHFDESDEYKKLKADFIKKSEFSPIIFNQSSIHSMLWKDDKYSYPLLTVFLPFENDADINV
ncbi:MAG: hypothetical protein IPL55_07370 [Saprospiraceae bacterium]|nr:hypothetical protein [Saprospiraceae bacterium]